MLPVHDVDIGVDHVVRRVGPGLLLRVIEWNDIESLESVIIGWKDYFKG